MPRKKRFTESFRDSACKLVTEQDYSIREAARSLGISDKTLNYWLHRRRPADPLSETPGSTTAGGDAAARDPGVMAREIQELQDKVRRLEMEKEILKKATAFFAKEQS
jgi:transposase